MQTGISQVFPAPGQRVRGLFVRQQALPAASPAPTGNPPSDTGKGARR